MERKDNTYRISLIVLIVTYIVGIAGFQWPGARPYFLLLTPFHLLLTAFLLVINSKEKGSKLWIFMCCSALFGYVIEVVGVWTGLIFGKYHYGNTLGIKFLEVPLMIGVNWFLLTYAIGMTVKSFIKNDSLAMVGAAILLVGMDYFIEPVAIGLDFWSWDNGIIPMHNYIGWFFTALGIMFVFRSCRFKKVNPLAIYVLLAQLVFFIILGHTN